jgi:hypothetical protein
MLRPQIVLPSWAVSMNCVTLTWCTASARAPSRRVGVRTPREVALMCGNAAASAIMRRRQ